LGALNAQRGKLIAVYGVAPEALTSYVVEPSSFDEATDYSPASLVGDTAWA